MVAALAAMPLANATALPSSSSSQLVLELAHAGFAHRGARSPPAAQEKESGSLMEGGAGGR